MIPAELLGIGVICLILAAVGFFLIRFFRSTGRGAYELEEMLGGIGCVQVGIAVGRGGRLVELTVPQQGEDMEIEIHTYLTATQAKLVAEWLRTAAAPGRTLDEVRDRTRKVSA